MTNNSRLHHILALFLSALVFISFWLFSRFTVDDAFISWRYGKNLVDFGIWNYNPAIFDMTQAYTNPIFAALSIIPNFLKIDVVLFFKFFALLTLTTFFYWFTRKAKNGLIMALIFFALPATFIHAFSGLETFLFVALMAALLILLFEEKFYPSVLITLLLFFTRPEAWLLVVLLPLYFLAVRIERNNQDKDFKSIFSSYKEWDQLSWKSFTLAFLLLIIPLVLYFIFHKLHFNSALPNTFYIKSAKSLSIFNLINLIKFSFWALPLLILIPLKKMRLFIFSFMMLGAMIVSYSTSNLQMNYAGRFEFHIFAPVYFFVVYIATKQTQNFFYVSSSSKSFERSFKISFQLVINIALILFLLLFTNRVTRTSHAYISNYYPRAIDSHAALGKTLQTITEKYKLKSFSFGDAGMAAYHSKLIALDNLGLGSSAVAASGVTLGILDAYNPDITVFHARPEGIDHNQEIVYKWSLANGMQMVCDVYWRPDYTMRVFAKKAYPEIVQLCNQSEKRNNQNDEAYFMQTWMHPPWSYWKE